ncbi:M20/M25/M40 family metallo-hydrolase [Sphingomonas gilva]|uniref:M20/M25/M40 family metallo-hydrolase n=1 Tax=Sphingomonas gilva TaxID=2305907 RepID=A0A396RQ37_9SPHN|nr:M28 family metallopeptidase [Sphingomonas gilva]RHW18509.1 M20/M25/M40 family metallo-hydrolase [Sphingomonas gilva]
MKALFTLAAMPLLTAAASGDPVEAVSERELRAGVERLVGFGTRHTLSSQTDARRGIGAARRWAEARFRRISKDCRGCLQIALPEKMVSGDRIPAPVRLVDVVAIQRGTERPGEVVIIQGHIDSRASGAMDAESDAPGANDNASGTAAVIEAARVLSKQRYPSTIVYAVLSGEEQGLYGGALLAEWVKAQGWTVKAVLNNDIIGGSRGSDGKVDDATVRVFSEGPRADATPEITANQRRRGGENDSPSRNLSRFVDVLADRAKVGLDVRQIWRTDRFGRGGDHLPMLAAGIPAIRLSVGIEDYDHQHQDLRTENGRKYGDTIDEMDFAYLARVTRLNVAALDHLARAPMPPASTVEGAVKPDTTLAWTAVPGAAKYIVRWRETDANQWRHAVELPGTATGHVLTGVRVDDWVFGVSSVSGEGVESPVASAVPGGAFAPINP